VIRSRTYILYGVGNASFGSETLPSACYILFPECNLPFNFLSNGYKYDDDDQVTGIKMGALDGFLCYGYGRDTLPKQTCSAQTNLCCAISPGICTPNKNLHAKSQFLGICMPNQTL